MLIGTIPPKDFIHLAIFLAEMNPDVAIRLIKSDEGPGALQDGKPLSLPDAYAVHGDISQLIIPGNFKIARDEAGRFFLTDGQQLCFELIEQPH